MRGVLLVLITTAFLHAQNSSDIDPMVGADNGGNVFVGPTLPFGMAKPGPDYGDNEGNAGWEASGALNGTRSCMFRAQAAGRSMATSWCSR